MSRGIALIKERIITLILLSIYHETKWLSEVGGAIEKQTLGNKSNGFLTQKLKINDDKTIKKRIKTKGMALFDNHSTYSLIMNLLYALNAKFSMFCTP